MMTTTLWIAGWLRYDCSKNDIYIVSYPRSGTTLVQMIVYQLLSDGDLGIQHISQVIPFLERSVQTGRDVNRARAPRVLKTHLSYRWLKWWKGKYIYVMRDGKDVVVSYYHFYSSYFGYKGSFEEFFLLFMSGSLQAGSWKEHVTDWINCPVSRDVLYLQYEDLVASPEACICRLATFCGVTLNPDALSRVLERSSFRFMKQHENIFDPAEEYLWEQGIERGHFIRQGVAGQYMQYLNQQHLSYFSDR